MKGRIDTGSDETLMNQRIGDTVVDKGKKSQIHSVLNEEEPIMARTIEGFLNTGWTEIMIVEEMSKPNNSPELMRILRKILCIPEDKNKSYNVDEEFICREIYILISVKSCRVHNLKLEK